MNRRRIGRMLLRALGVLGAIVLALVAIAALSNLLLPGRPEMVERLSEADKARVAEATHLRQTLGSSVWPGWGEADIPVIAYNDEYAFLLGYSTGGRPPDGWVKVPQGTSRGGPWEVVPGDTFEGKQYYRQKLPGDGVTPQAFTVLVGQRWTASMTTKDAMTFGIGDQMHRGLPMVLRDIFPYKIFARMLVGSNDQYVCLVLHEAFHAYQGMEVPARLAASENANNMLQDQYPWNDQSLRQGWQRELDTLANAAATSSDAQARELASKFLAIRDERRAGSELSPALVGFERQREWLEGLARYTELTIWQRGATIPGYVPVPAIERDRDFHDYQAAGERWSQELDQARRMAGDEGDGRFYYSGMLQAALLDRLAPGWKSTIFEQGVWLEDLLREAISE